MANSDYSLPATAALGTWTSVLLDSGGAEIARVTFDVTSAAWVTMTVDGGTIDFSAMDPGTLSSIHSVNVSVGASGPYMLSKTTSGDAAAMGLSITGSATVSWRVPVRTATTSRRHRRGLPRPASASR